MKFTKTDFKSLVVIMVAVVAIGLLLYAGDEYDIPVLKQARNGLVD